MYRCTSPVLLIGFNRPECIRSAIDALRKVRPSKIYFAVDGPRNSEETPLVVETQSAISSVDWDCKIETLFRSENLGCKHGVSSAISWVFDHEEFAIIIEDDIVASEEFFKLCDNLSKIYHQDERVYMISGTNYVPDEGHPNSYVFTQNYTIWGWATWRRCWQDYDVEMKMWRDTDTKASIRKNCRSWFQWKYWERTFNALHDNYSDTWDIQWVFHCIVNSGLCATSTTNLISNIGIEGVHSSTQTDSHFMKVQKLDLSKKGPGNYLVDIVYDSKIVRKKYIKLILLDYLKSLIRPIYKKISRKS